MRRDGASGAISLLFLSLDLSSIFLGCNWFEGKIELEMVLCQKRVILRSTRKLISVWPNFLCLPNTQRGVKWFLETLFSQNKCTLGVYVESAILPYDEQKLWTQDHNTVAEKRVSANTRWDYCQHLQTFNIYRRGLLQLSTSFWKSNKRRKNDGKFFFNCFFFFLV